MVEAERKSIYSDEVSRGKSVKDSNGPTNTSNKVSMGEKDGANQDRLDKTESIENAPNNFSNPSSNNKDVSDEIKPKTINEQASRRGKKFGHRDSGYSNWTIKEEQYLINSAGMLSDEELAEKMTKICGRLITKTSVRRKRQRLGLCKTGGRGVKVLSDKAKKSKKAPKDSALKHHKDYVKEWGLDKRFKSKKTIETDINKIREAEQEIERKKNARKRK